MNKHSHDNHGLMLIMMAMCSLPLAFSIMANTGWPIVLRILAAAGVVIGFLLLHRLMMGNVHDDRGTASKDDQRDAKDTHHTGHC